MLIQPSLDPLPKRQTGGRLAALLAKEATKGLVVMPQDPGINHPGALMMTSSSTGQTEKARPTLGAVNAVYRAAMS